MTKVAMMKAPTMTVLVMKIILKKLPVMTVVMMIALQIVLRSISYLNSNDDRLFEKMFLDEEYDIRDDVHSEITK